MQSFKAYATRIGDARALAAKGEDRKFMMYAYMNYQREQKEAKSRTETIVAERSSFGSEKVTTLMTRHKMLTELGPALAAAETRALTARPAQAV